MSFLPSQLPAGPSLRTTSLINVQEIYRITQDNPGMRDIMLKIYQDLSDILKVLNMKTTGIYWLQESQNNNVYFSNPALSSSSASLPALRNVFSKTFDTGQLPNATTLTIAHNIPFNDAYTMVDYFGSATDSSGLNYICLPYSSPTSTDCIEVRVDATNIYITTGSNRSNFDRSQIVLEYLKN